jgi:predicted aminopeptidase
MKCRLRRSAKKYRPLSPGAFRLTAVIRFFLVLPVLFLTGCGALQFYTQGAAGQMEIMRKSRPNAEVIADASTSETLRKRLLLTAELCDFASRGLALPGDSSYGRYADLGRRHVVFVLYAAREFSLEPKTWRYPVVGEMDYRGYFKEEDAKTYAEKLEAEGYETYLGGTDAYSTLGFFHDPVLNTFAAYPEIDFAELIFHELTHRRVFRKGETTFNESLATAVAEEGVRRWLVTKGRRADLADYEERLIRRRDFYREIETTRRELTELYSSELPADEMRKRKHAILAELKDRARALQRRWGGKQLEAWIRLELTNAHLLPLITYNSETETFRKLIKESGGDFEAFFRKVEKMETPLLP